MAHTPILDSSSAKTGLKKTVAMPLGTITWDTLLAAMPETPAESFSKTDLAVFCWLAALLANDEPQPLVRLQLAMKEEHDDDVMNVLGSEGTAFVNGARGFKRTKGLIDAWNAASAAP